MVLVQELKEAEISEQDSLLLKAKNAIIELLFLKVVVHKLKDAEQDSLLLSYIRGLEKLSALDIKIDKLMPMDSKSMIEDSDIQDFKTKINLIGNVGTDLTLRSSPCKMVSTLVHMMNTLHNEISNYRDCSLLRLLQRIIVRVVIHKLNDAEISERDSLLLPKRNLVAIPIFTYIRGLLENFTTLDMEIEKLMRMHMHSRQSIDSMEKGVYYSLQRKYLNTLMFSIVETAMIEEYYVTTNNHGGTFNATVDINQMRSTPCKMVFTITTMDKMMLAEPRDYEPPFFICTAEEEEAEYVWTKIPLEMEIRNVNRKHFVLTLKAKSDLQSLPNKLEHSDDKVDNESGGLDVPNDKSDELAYDLSAADDDMSDGGDLCDDDDVSDEESGEDVSDEESGEDVSDEESGEDVSDEESGEDASDEESGEDASDEESGEDVSDEELGEDVSDEDFINRPNKIWWDYEGMGVPKEMEKTMKGRTPENKAKAVLRRFQTGLKLKGFNGMISTPVNIVLGYLDTPVKDYLKASPDFEISYGKQMIRPPNGPERRAAKRDQSADEKIKKEIDEWRKKGDNDNIMIITGDKGFEETLENLQDDGIVSIAVCEVDHHIEERNYKNVNHCWEWLEDFLGLEREVNKDAKKWSEKKAARRKIALEQKEKEEEGKKAEEKVKADERRLKKKQDRWNLHLEKKAEEEKKKVEEESKRSSENQANKKAKLEDLHYKVSK